jgi:hypothetical protein
VYAVGSWRVHGPNRRRLAFPPRLLFGSIGFARRSKKLLDRLAQEKLNGIKPLQHRFSVAPMMKFYDRLFLSKRYEAPYAECVQREVVVGRRWSRSNRLGQCNS